MNFNHCYNILVLFSAAGNHCFKKVLVDLKGKEGAQTNQIIVFFTKEQRRDVESFLFHSGQWILASPLVCFGAKGNGYTGGSL